MDNSRHQGKFHLLIIVAIPVLFLLVFLVQNWYATGAFLIALALAVYLLFFRKKS